VCVCVCVYGEPAFYRFIIVVPVFLKSVPKFFDHKCNKDFHVHFYTAKNVNCVESYLEQKILGQILYQVRSEPNFYLGSRSKRTNVSVIRENSG
jgi:hypothetical protein